MEKIFKFYFIAGCIVFFLLGGAIAFNISGTNSGASGRSGQKFSAATSLNRIIADEQRRELERNKQAVAAVERLRGIHQEADSAIRELGLVNRGSGDLSALIRAEVNILEDYFRSVGSELDNFYSGAGE